jgi:hypothetical protein
MRHGVQSRDVHTACTFVRAILSERLAVPLTVLSHVRGERVAVTQQVWESPSQLFAVSHAVIGAVNERADELSGFLNLRTPLTRALAGKLPGRFHLYLGTRGCVADADAMARIRSEIVRQLLKVAGEMGVGEWRTLVSARVPFSFQVHRADAFGSDLLVGRRVGDIDAVRLARARRVLALVSPGLERASSRLDATSVLILETRDRNRANGSLMADAILITLSARIDQPDIVVLVETDAPPLQAWIVADCVDLYPTGRPLPHFYQDGRSVTS